MKGKSILGNNKMENIENEKRFFDRYFSTHIVGRKGIPTIDNFQQKAKGWTRIFKNHLPGDKKAQIIDIGCGTGGIVWWLQQSGYINTEGIDLSGEQVEQAQKLGIKSVSQSDLFEFLKDINEKYDLILMRDVLEHLPKDSVLNALYAICRSLKKTGKLLIQVPNAESPFFGRIRYGDFTHQNAFTTTSLSQILLLTGFSSFSFYPVAPVYTGLSSIKRLLLWIFIEEIYKLLLYGELGKGNRIVTQCLLASASK